MDEKSTLVHHIAEQEFYRHRDLDAFHDALRFYRSVPIEDLYVLAEVDQRRIAEKSTSIFDLK